MKKLIAVLTLGAVLLVGSPASADIIRPDTWKGPAWAWGECRHHDAPWGAGREYCQIVAWSRVGR